MKRPLSQHERLTCSAAPVFQSIGAITVRIRGPLSADQLRAALARVFMRQPLLGVRVGDVHRWGAHFLSDGVPEPSVRLIKGGAGDTWQSVTQEEIAQPFPFDTGPLIRFALLQSGEVSELVVAANHVILDGVSIHLLIPEILWQLGDPASAPPIPQQFPPMEALLPVAQTARAGRLPSAPKPARGVAPSAQAGPSTFVSWSLDEAESASLCTRSRAERTTVQAVIGAAFLRACAELDPSSAFRRIETPINLRGRLPQLTAGALGNYMTLVETTVDCGPGRSIWDVARTYKQRLTEQLDSDDLFQRWRSLRNFAARIPNPVLSWLMRLLWRSAIKISYDLSITNVGRVEFPTAYGPLQIEDIYPPVLSIVVPEHRLLSVLTFNGRITMALSTCDPTVALQIKERGLRHLRQALA